MSHSRLLQLISHLHFVLHNGSHSRHRYFKVVRPRLYPRYFTKMRVVSLLVSIWIINIVVVLAPVLGGWARFEFTDMFRACVVKFPPNREASWAGFEFTVFSLIPMITISFCYYKVSKTIQQHNHITLASLQARSTCRDEC